MLAIIYFMTIVASSVVSQSTKNVSVFILGGQSNMVGEGGVSNGARYSDDKWDGVIPPQCQSNPSILRLGAQKKWEEAREPLHSLYGSTTLFGIGPGMPFANALLERDPSIGVIGLVPCAVAGSYIISWSRNSTNYMKMLTSARAAVTQGGVLRGFLWYQGESDSRDQTSAEAYQARLVELFNNFREDLQLPSLPIIQVALASGFDFKDTVRQAQLHTELANVKCVDADGLQLAPPSCSQNLIPEKCLHLSAPAQVQLGTMMANAFLQE